MRMKRLFSSVALVAAIVASTSAARAATFTFNFSGTEGSYSLTASGTIDVTGGYAIDGTGSVTGTGSALNGTEALTLMTLTSPATVLGGCCYVTNDGGGVFSYRWASGTDLIADDAVPLTGEGLLFGLGPFNAAGASPSDGSFPRNPGYALGLNIWSNGGNSFTAYLQNDNGNNDQYNGTFSLSETMTSVAAPLPSTWTMLITGFLGLGFLAYRGSRKRLALGRLSS